ncbi:uncharacterized protein LOC117739233 [Cyclopterus lumpus]|uniref:uncharacterized protein LOC117739233 n=1 Tax=Cyclopterus lumpus TaxID=8103 RepID=UPI0014875839|nr:uncharacterized protein LOC117739233 [Cyclopterus lumpus]
MKSAVKDLEANIKSIEEGFQRHPDPGVGRLLKERRSELSSFLQEKGEGSAGRPPTREMRTHGVISWGCKDPKLRHVLSLRRQAFMFLDSPTQTLEVSFRVKHLDGSYAVYASSGQIKCFECGDVGHKRFSCPHKKQKRAEAPAAAVRGWVHCALVKAYAPLVSTHLVCAYKRNQIASQLHPLQRRTETQSRKEKSRLQNHDRQDLCRPRAVGCPNSRTDNNRRCNNRRCNNRRCNNRRCNHRRCNHRRCNNRRCNNRRCNNRRCNHRRCNNRRCNNRRCNNRRCNHRRCNNRRCNNRRCNNRRCNNRRCNNRYNQRYNNRYNQRYNNRYNHRRCNHQQHQSLHSRRGDDGTPTSVLLLTVLSADLLL